MSGIKDIIEKKKYVRPIIKLIELSRGQTEGSPVVLQPAQPPTSTSNVTGGVVFG